MTNINSGTATLREITSQNHWHVASLKTFICFVQSLTHGQGKREGRGGVRENKTGESAKLITACEQEAASRNGRGSGATTSESFKPVIAADDAEQDSGFLQHVEAKQIPVHGRLQTETDLGFRC